jgi:hypothetical protein
MARKFLTPIDLNKLELQNAAIQNLGTDPESPTSGQIYYNTNDSKLKVYNGSSWTTVGNTQEEIEDYINGLITAGSGISVDYDDDGNSLTIANTGVTSLTGTANEVTVSASAGDITISLPDTVNVDISGTAASATYAVTAGTANAVAADSVALGTDTTGDYVASISGTENEIEVSGTGEGASVTIGLPTSISVDVTGDLTGNVSIPDTGYEILADESGDLYVKGTSSDGDIIIRTNSDGFGQYDFVFGKDGSLTTDGDVTIGGNLTISGSATYVNTEIIELDDNTIVLNANATTASENAGIEVERGTIEANVSVLWNESNDNWTLTNDGTNYHAITRKYSANVGDTSNTEFALDHNLGTRDVTVQVYDNATYDTVEVDVVRTSTTRVTVTFATAPGNNAYRVVIVG